MNDDKGLVEQLRYGKDVESWWELGAQAAVRIQVLTDRIAVLEGLAEQAALALNPFIYIIAHRFDGDGSYYWMRDPTHDEAQAAMAATNAVSAALTPQESSSNAE